MGQRQLLQMLKKYKSEIPRYVYHEFWAALNEPDYAFEGPFEIFSTATTDRFKALGSIVASQMRVTVEQIRARTRKDRVVDAKTILIHEVLLTNIFPSMRSLALMFSGFTHADIIYHKKRYQNLYEVDKEFRAKAKDISQLINKHNYDNYFLKKQACTNELQVQSKANNEKSLQNLQCSGGQNQKADKKRLSC